MTMRNVLIFITILGLSSCNRQSTNTRGYNRTGSNASGCSNSEYLAQAVLWFQRSPEMQALYLQSFNFAKEALEINLSNKRFPGKKNAVVVDIDETILNNGPYEGWLFINDKTFADSSWNAWINASEAEPLPGAAD